MSDVRSSHGTYRRLLRYARPYRGRLLLGVLFAIICGGSTAGALLSLGENVEHFFNLESGAMDGRSTLLIGITLPAFMVLLGIGYYLSVYFIHWVGFRVITDLRRETFAHLQELPFMFFATHKTGDLISRISNDTTQVQQAVSSTVGDMIREPFVLIAAIGVAIWKLAQVDALQAGWLFTLMPVCILPVLLIGKMVRRYSRQNQERLAGLVSVLQENISGARIVKAFGMEAYEEKKFRKENERVFSRLLKMTMARALNHPLMMLIAAISVVFALAYAKRINMPVSDFITVIGALVMSYQPVKRLGRVHMTIQQSAAAADRIFELLDYPVEIQDKPEAEALVENIKEITFEQVSFHYTDQDPVLDGVNLRVEAGQCIAIVGSAGSGKSTLVNLLPRFFEVSGGRVAINGKDIRDFTLASLRRNVAVVSQDTFLFHDTIANNIAYGIEDPDREKIEQAARRAHAHEFITEKPEGYETMVGDRGVTLSGGEKQRVTIARAFYRDAPILILDEATSSLDNESERLVQAAIDKLMEGRIVFAIAHRLSTIQHADHILVLKEGKIVEEGKHENLLEQGGVYHYLYELAHKQ